MSRNVIIDKDLRNAVDVMRSYGFGDQSSMIDLLYRVVKTKQSSSGKDDNADIVYKTMQEVSTSLPRFPGDAELFFSIYKTLSPIDERSILSFMNIANDGRELYVPDVLVENFSKYFNDNTKKILVTECEQYGPSLLDLVEANPEIEFTLVSRQAIKAELISIAYSHIENVKMISADIYSYGFTDRKFDLIFCVPIFGGRMLVNGEDFISREPDLIAVQNLLYHINMDGELVIVLPAKITFGGGSAAALREYIESNYKIKEISALPAGLFTPYTSIRTYLFVFSTGQTDDVVLRQYSSDKPIRKTSPCKKLVIENELLLFSDEFADLNGWNIDMAFSEEDEDMKSFASSPVKKLRLKDAATVFRGKAVNTKSESGNIAVINISNITDTGIDYEALDFIEEEPRKVSRYVLEDGDVLVTARGTTVKVAVFEKQPTICIPSANINVIRPKEMLRGGYLKLFLESPVGIKMLQSLQRGTVVVNINYRDIIELEVPVLPLEAQDALIQEYNTGLKFYKETIAAAEEGWRGVRHDIESKLF
ncbi:MAG: restriction endonuclease subunit S [Clostridiales bacterium]|nr:restriction endonuclease subunit S [Clostridiales bacterium]